MKCNSSTRLGDGAPAAAGVAVPAPRASALKGETVAAYRRATSRDARPKKSGCGTDVCTFRALGISSQ
ncbi:MAG: hypothetical protein MZV70_62480 [Desulfobacterales bacterium]|nr:hypothetical protein [Desulfobacterales bacterium]